MFKYFILLISFLVTVTAFSPPTTPPNVIIIKGEFAEWNNVILQLQSSNGPHQEVVRAINFIYNQYPDSIKHTLQGK